MYGRRLSFTVPAAAGQYAPEVLYLNVDNNPRSGVQRVLELTPLIEAGLPAGAVLEMDVLKQGGLPSNNADWITAQASWNAVGLQDAKPLSGWNGVRLRVKSGGAAGEAIAAVAWF